MKAWLFFFNDEDIYNQKEFPLLLINYVSAIVEAEK